MVFIGNFEKYIYNNKTASSTYVEHAQVRFEDDQIALALTYKSNTPLGCGSVGPTESVRLPLLPYSV